MAATRCSPVARGHGRRPCAAAGRGIAVAARDGPPSCRRRRAAVHVREPRAAARRCETLRESRSAVLDVEASELHRIERDLHDGAQQRLVMLNIDLGMAAERVDTDPAAAKALILEGQAQAREALAEIRDLVRGYRAVDPASTGDWWRRSSRSSAAARCRRRSGATLRRASASPLRPSGRPTSSRPRRLPMSRSTATRRAARFAVSRDGSRLVVEVWDDGTGGATTPAGGGLAGLASRVAGVDGTFSLSSPHGGPTIVRSEIPL